MIEFTPRREAGRSKVLLTSNRIARHHGPMIPGFVLAILVAWSPPVGAQQQSAVIGGILLDRTTRIPIEGARVNVLGTTLRTSSDSAGRFDVAGVPPGVRVIQARAVGYAIGSWMVELGEGQRLNQVFELDGRTLTVDSVTVVADGDQGWRSEAGFEHRR